MSDKFIISIPLLKNNRKERESQPDYTSPGKKVEEEGGEVRWLNAISAWKKTGKNGDVYLSLSINVDDLSEWHTISEAEKEKRGAYSPSTDI